MLCIPLHSSTRAAAAKQRIGPPMVSPDLSSSCIWDLLFLHLVSPLLLWFPYSPHLHNSLAIFSSSSALFAFRFQQPRDDARPSAPFSCCISSHDDTFSPPHILSHSRLRQRLLPPRHPRLTPPNPPILLPNTSRPSHLPDLPGKSASRKLRLHQQHRPAGPADIRELLQHTRDECDGRGGGSAGELFG